MSETPRDSADVYLAVVERLEPDLTSVTIDASLTSIAISLKRIVDVLTAEVGNQNQMLSDAIYSGIYNTLVNNSRGLR